VYAVPWYTPLSFPAPTTKPGCIVTFRSASAWQVPSSPTRRSFELDPDATGSGPSSATVTRSTDGHAPNSGPAFKDFVDANIQVTPAGAHGLGTPHNFTLSLTGVPGRDATATSLTVAPTSRAPAPAV